MALIVQKYGGSSVASPQKLAAIAEKIVATKRAGNRLVVVVSAMGKTTDNLIALARSVHPNPPERELDLLLSTGEKVSVALLCMAIENLGEEAEGFPGYLAGIETDSFHTRARIQKIDPRRLAAELERDRICVVAGFQGMSCDHNITTLGRGGSDLTAIALATSLHADLCEIYTDVDGVFTADPHRVPEARLIPVLSYDEMLEMASMGAKVMQSRAVEFAKKYGVPFTVKSAFKEGAGTMIKDMNVHEGAVVSSVSLDEKQSKITVYRVPDRPGVSAKIFGTIAAEQINIDMIVQTVGRDNVADISFTVATTDCARALALTEKAAGELGAERVIGDPDIAKVSIIGIGMMNQPGVAARMFETLGRCNINIEMISTSEIKVSCVIRESEGERALKALHAEFIEKG